MNEGIRKNEQLWTEMYYEEIKIDPKVKNESSTTEKAEATQEMKA